MTDAAEGALAASVHARCPARYAVETTVRHHRVLADEPQARGGDDGAATPMELLAAALASCTAITLRMYAERKGWELGEVKVDCRTFTHGEGYRVERTVRFAAPLEDAQRERLLAIAEKTPVTKVVKNGAPIATRLA